jgi:hypothetical protein
MIRTSRTKKTQVKKVPNPRPPQPRPQHLVAVLQRPTQVTKSHSSSSRGGDKNPPSGKIEICHKLPAGKKRKTIVQEQEGPRGEIDIYDLSLEYMELEIDIDKMFPDNDHLESTAPHNPRMEIIGIDTLDEEDSFAFQSDVFDSESKNLIIEKRDVKNKKGTSRSEINLRNMHPSQISKMHRATGDALDNSITGLETENLMLKKQIKELEETLMPLPLFATPLEMVGSTAPASKLKASASLLTSARDYVEKNINRMMELIIEA